MIQGKTIISMQVVGIDFQRLTCVTAIERVKEGNFLVVDCPQGFSEAAQNGGPVNLRFSFIGSDHLEYLFNTTGGLSSGRDLKIPFPELVERLQRRRNFRIDTLPGTKLIFTAGKLKGHIDLINISLGGAFGVLAKHNQRDLKGSLFKMDQRLYKVRIVFPANNIMDKRKVIIKKAEVRRIEKDRERNRYKYAFEFLIMDKDNTHTLTQSIYHLQRQYLQNR